MRRLAERVAEAAAAERVGAREQPVEHQAERVPVRGRVPHGAVGLLGRRPERGRGRRRPGGTGIAADEGAGERVGGEHRARAVDAHRLRRHRAGEERGLLGGGERTGDRRREREGLAVRPRAAILAQSLGERQRRQAPHEPHALVVEASLGEAADAARAEREQPVAHRLVPGRQVPDLDASAAVARGLAARLPAPGATGARQRGASRERERAALHRPPGLGFRLSLPRPGGAVTAPAVAPAGGSLGAAAERSR